MPTPIKEAPTLFKEIPTPIKEAPTPIKEAPTLLIKEAPTPMLWKFKETPTLWIWYFKYLPTPMLRKHLHRNSSKSRLINMFADAKKLWDNNTLIIKKQLLIVGF